MDIQAHAAPLYLFGVRPQKQYRTSGKELERLQRSGETDHQENLFRQNIRSPMAYQLYNEKSRKNGEQESCYIPREQNDARRVEFHLGFEQGRVAAGTDIGARTLFFVQRTGTSVFGAFMSQHLIGLGVETLAPLVVGKFLLFAVIGHDFSRISNVDDIMNCD